MREKKQAATEALLTVCKRFFFAEKNAQSNSSYGQPCRIDALFRERILLEFKSNIFFLIFFPTTKST